MLAQIEGKLEKIKRYDGYIATVCPWHDDNKPSLLVFDDGWFTCLACEKRGTVDMLVSKLNGASDVHLNRISSGNEKADRLPDVPTSQMDREEWSWMAHLFLLNDPSTGWYLTLRGIEDSIEKQQIGWSNGWYSFPFFGETGKFMGMVLRASAYVQRDTGHRYYIPRGQKPSMFVPDWNLIRQKPYLFVVYGIIDAIALAQLRIPVVTTSGGKNSFNDFWLKDYRSRIFVLPDKGEETTAHHLVSGLGWRGKVVQLNYPDGFKDPADFLQHGKEQLLLNQLAGYVT